MNWHLLEADEISKKLHTTSNGLDENTAKKYSLTREKIL